MLFFKLFCLIIACIDVLSSVTAWRRDDRPQLRTIVNGHKWSYRLND
jgi:hypothetical protein